MTRRSLRLRLFLAGALAVVAALILAAGGLILLFEHHVERTLDDDLDAYVRQIGGPTGERRRDRTSTHDAIGE